MAIVHRPGTIKRSPDTGHTYEIVKELNRGNYANSYQAKRSDGTLVFLKEYKDPGPASDSFEDFIGYQEKIRRAIESDPDARSYCYKFLDFFVDTYYCQAIEFIKDGMSLASCLESAGARPHSLDWDKRVFFARVLTLGIAALHKVGIVHGDLKPDNVFLIPAPGRDDHWLRIIDLDWAFFADDRPSWASERGYVSSPFYSSPEHVRGEPPGYASDAFTCGLMLGELLGSGHPVRSKVRDQDEYERAIVAGRPVTPIKISDDVPKVKDKGFLEAVLNSCLDPDPARRPAVSQARGALLGKEFPWGHYRRSTGSETKPSSTTTQGIRIIFDERKVTEVRIDSSLGRGQFRHVHDDYQYLAERQFLLYRDPAAGHWMIAPEPGVANATIVNGMPLDAPTAVTNGMVVAVGNVAKGIQKLPLKLELI